MRVLLLFWTLLLAGAASAGELKLATWNLDWLTWRPPGDPALPRDVAGAPGKDWAKLRAYVAALDADVVALEEVDGPEAARRIFPGYGLHFTADPVVQRVGFAWKPALHVVANPDVVGLALGEEGERRLRSGADITLVMATAQLRLLAVHLKSGCWRDPLGRRSRAACPVLRAQLPVLRGWVAARRHEGTPFALLGDFNREMDQPEAFWKGLSEAAPLRRATAGHSSPCWGGTGFIDHIILGGAATAWLRPDSLRVLVYHEQNPALREALSDHCPVSVRLDLPD